MNEIIRKADTDLLWALLSDVTAIIDLRKYKPDTSDKVFMFWYELYKAIDTEINHRMSVDF